MHTAQEDYITGVFVKELKNRFLCLVNVSGNDAVCYVPLSCHLSNFLELRGKTVMLKPTESKNSRTKYTIWAIPYKRNQIILNASMANKALENNIKSRRFSFLGKRHDIRREHYIDGYKADFFIKDSNTLIEVKSIISVEDIAIFPTVFSERTHNQLLKIQELISGGYKAFLIIVSLNPYVKKIRINKDTDFYIDLKRCISLGLNCRAYSCKLNGNNAPILFKEIELLDI